MGKPAAPALRHVSSRTDHWTNPRPHTDASARFRKHGPVVGMPEEPRDWFHIILWAGMIIGFLAVATFAFLSAASPARPDAQQPVAFEARAGGKVSS